PVSTEALTGLLNQIKHSSCDGNERSKARHERLVQKLANAAQRLFARQALDQNYIGILRDANNEAKTRRKTKSEILQKVEKDGNGRVVMYEDLEMIRADRARKKAAKEAKEAQGKGKRGRPKAAAEADQGKGNMEKRVRNGKTTVLEAHSLDDVQKIPSAIQMPIDPMLESWRALEAQMW
ncbi:hypothetical protein COCHEDRAFT_1062214, partial [Bipolaris maydis C5]